MDSKSSMHKFAEWLLITGIEYSQSTNIALSPCSAQTALSLALAGADGYTELETRQALGFENASRDDVSLQLSAMWKAIMDVSDRCNFKVANALWHSRKSILRADFFSATLAVPHGEIIDLDFSNIGNAVETINKWVQAKTENNIKELVTERTLPGDILAVITNAVYFKEKWIDPFDPEKTRPGQFQTPEGHVVAQFMNKNCLMHVHNGSGFKSVYLPYACGSDICMQLILPDPGISISSGAIASAGISCAGIRRNKESVNISLPKFKIAGPAISLLPHLRNLGMRLAFSSNADFSRMTDGRLYISDVMHRVTIEVDEQGTEASAATAVAMSRCMPMQLIFDRPFIFVIWIAPYDMPLFVGVVADPSQN